jgi:DNA polymerase III subunit delta'
VTSDAATPPGDGWDDVPLDRDPSAAEPSLTDGWDDGPVGGAGSGGVSSAGSGGVSSAGVVSRGGSSAADPVDPWGRVIGQPAAVTALRAALLRDGVAHAWMLVGPRKVGQEELSRALGAALNCPQARAADAGCGACDTCRRILDGRHPAVFDLEPKGAYHLVDDVRTDWIPLSSRTMTEGRRRVLRIVAADGMNEAAQNAFLKVLEEPPPSVVWLLEVEDEGALLDTVISRCRRLDLVPWSRAALAQRAAELDLPAELGEAAIRAALGSPERLAALAQPDRAAARRRHLELIDRLAIAGPGAVVPVAKELVAWAKGQVAPVKAANADELEELERAFGVDQRGSRGWPPGMKKQITRKHERLERSAHLAALSSMLDDLSSYLRDLVAVASGADADALVNVDAESELRRDAERLPIVDAVAALAAVAACRDALEHNGSPELQLERLLLRLALPIYAAAAA